MHFKWYFFKTVVVKYKMFQNFILILCLITIWNLGYSRSARRQPVIGPILFSCRYVDILPTSGRYGHVCWDVAIFFILCVCVCVCKMQLKFNYLIAKKCVSVWQFQEAHVAIFLKFFLLKKNKTCRWLEEVTLVNDDQ